MLRKHHKIDRKLIIPIIPNTSKTSRTSLGHGSMRLIRQRNNPNKETLIYIHLSNVTVIQAYITRVAKQHNELYISILL